jgi:hypothetical protein
MKKLATKFIKLKGANSKNLTPGGVFIMPRAGA